MFYHRSDDYLLMTYLQVNLSGGQKARGKSNRIQLPRLSLTLNENQCLLHVLSTPGLLSYF